MRLQMFIIRTSWPNAISLLIDVSSYFKSFLLMTSSKDGGIFFSFVRILAHIEEVGNHAYEFTSSLTSLCLRSVITFLSVFVEICFDDAMDSSVDSESVKRLAGIRCSMSRYRRSSSYLEVKTASSTILIRFRVSASLLLLHTLSTCLLFQYIGDSLVNEEFANSRITPPTAFSSCL